MYKKIIFILLILLGGVGWYAYQLQQRPVVALQVGPFICKASCFAQALADKLKDMDNLTAQKSSVLTVLKQQVVQDFIVQSVVADWAQKNSIFVKEDEITQHMNRVRQQYPSDLQLQETLTDQGLDFQKWRHKIKQSLLEKKVVQKVHQSVRQAYSDEQLKTYYETHRDQFKLKAQVKLSHIVVPSIGPAQQIRRQLEKGQKWDQIAQPAGGVKNVDWVEKGSFELFDEAFLRPVGWLSPVRKSHHGFHIVRVEGRRPARELSFEALRSKIEAILRTREQEKAYNQWLEAGLKELKIYKNEAFIEGLQVEAVQSY